MKGPTPIAFPEHNLVIALTARRLPGQADEAFAVTSLTVTAKKERKKLATQPRLRSTTIQIPSRKYAKAVFKAGNHIRKNANAPHD